VIELTEAEDGRVTVDMGAPVFDLAALPFDPTGLTPVPRRRPTGRGAVAAGPIGCGRHRRPVGYHSSSIGVHGQPARRALVDDVAPRPCRQGPLIERHPAFPRRVNAGFMQVVDRAHVRLRVYERGGRDPGLRHRRLRGRGGRHPPGPAGCASDVATRGLLTIEWAGGHAGPVR
jgi:diaminopimelate epimerase